MDRPHDVQRNVVMAEMLERHGYAHQRHQSGRLNQGGDLQSPDLRKLKAARVAPIGSRNAVCHDHPPMVGAAGPPARAISASTALLARSSASGSWRKRLAVWWLR